MNSGGKKKAARSDKSRDTGTSNASPKKTKGCSRRKGERGGGNNYTLNTNKHNSKRKALNRRSPGGVKIFKKNLFKKKGRLWEVGEGPQKGKKKKKECGTSKGGRCRPARGRTPSRKEENQVCKRKKKEKYPTAHSRGTKGCMSGKGPERKGEEAQDKTPRPRITRNASRGKVLGGKKDEARPSWSPSAIESQKKKDSGGGYIEERQRRGNWGVKETRR